MQYKDTLTLYDELIKGGASESQARVQAHQLGAMGDLFQVELRNISQSLDNGLKELGSKIDSIEKDMFWMRLIGASMTIAFFSNIVMCKL
jgi:hypothetical protein